MKDPTKKLEEKMREKKLNFTIKTVTENKVKRTMESMKKKVKTYS